MHRRRGVRASLLRTSWYTRYRSILTPPMHGKHRRKGRFENLHPLGVNCISEEEREGMLGRPFAQLMHLKKPAPVGWRKYSTQL